MNGGSRPGAGRPPRFPGEKMQVVNLKLPESMVIMLDRLKGEKGFTSRVDVVLWLLRNSCNG